MYVALFIFKKVSSRASISYICFFFLNKGGTLLLFLSSAGPLTNLLIEDVTFHSRSGGIHFGASAWYDYINVTINKVRVLDAHQGVDAQVRGPGSIRGLSVTNMLMTRTTFNAPCYPWMGNGMPISISADVWADGPAGSSAYGTVEDVLIENVTAQASNGFFVSGRVGGVSNVQFKNINLIIQQMPNNNASFGPCPSHNYWPTSRPTSSRLGGVVAPIDGLFVEFATNVDLQNFKVSFIGAPKPGNTFGRCVYADANSTSKMTGAARCVGENATAPTLSRLAM